MFNEADRRDFLKHIGIGAAVALPASGTALAATSATPSSSASGLYNIIDYGAIGDGKTVCTTAIQKAIDACAQNGGGKVVVPAGRFLTNALFLKSNVHVEILAGGTLVFISDIDSVPSVQGRWEGIDRTVYASLFNGQSLENISITGRGMLDGQGRPWWDAYRVTRDLRRKSGMGDEREPENPPGSPLKWGRPRMINLYDCKNILLSGINLQNSPSWNIHPVRCENVVIDGVTITAPSDSANTDGIDPDSCKNVRIANCYISVGDDCIIIKSGYRYREDGIPCENITVTNCVFGTGHCGVGIGSETSGGVRNVVVSNCICDGTERGLRIKTARGRGRAVENFRASNVLMRNMEREAIVVTMFYTGGDRHHAEPVTKFTPSARGFHFSDITIEGAKQGILIEGLAESPIRDVTLCNVDVMKSDLGASCINAAGVCLSNVSVASAKGAPFDFDSVSDLELLRVRTSQSREADPVVRLTNVADAAVQMCAPSKGAKSFLELKGAGTRGIALVANRFDDSKAVVFADGASKSAIVKGDLASGQ